MFPDYELVASVREELDIVVEEGVANIVQLLRNSESGTSSAAAKVVDEESFRSKNRKRTESKRWTHEDRASQDNADTTSAARKLPSKFADLMPEESLKGRKFSARLDDSSSAGVNKRRSGKLSAQLMDSGLLTKDMMKQLKREWTERMQLEIEESEKEHKGKKK